MIRKLCIVSILAAFIGLLILPAIGKKKEQSTVEGAKIFAQYCAKCHTGGGNLVKESHPLAGSKQLSTVAIFKAYLSAPPGHMPYYQNIVDDQKTLDALYKFCKQLKKKPEKQA